jgi:hypothetical protein
MDATLWTGDGGASKSITGVGFQPDLVWTKARSAAYDALITDAVRGSGKSLTPSSTGAEVTNNANGYLSSFNSDGFTVSQGASSALSINGSGVTYVGWQWKAGGSTSSNTNGSITSTVSVNATAGFSIATYTGTGANATVGHGLGVAPKMVIVKKRAGATTGDWAVWHTGLGTNVIYLNSTGASGADSTWFQGVVPSSTTFSVGTASITNQSTATFVAYCFSAVAGYSAFGSYTGNGSSDGPFVYCGFRPRWILYKNSTSATVGNWVIHDTSRSTYNAAQAELSPDVADAEPASSNAQLDILSNGFKLRGVSGNTSWNQSGVTYIYAAFAENPFKNALAR